MKMSQRTQEVLVRPPAQISARLMETAPSPFPLQRGQLTRQGFPLCWSLKAPTLIQRGQQGQPQRRGHPNHSFPNKRDCPQPLTEQVVFGFPIYPSVPLGFGRLVGRRGKRLMGPGDSDGVAHKALYSPDRSRHALP